MGVSVPDAVCTDRSVLVVTDHRDSALHTATAMTHLVAHLLGVRHDVDDAGEDTTLHEYVVDFGQLFSVL